MAEPFDLDDEWTEVSARSARTLLKQMSKATRGLVQSQHARDLAQRKAKGPKKKQGGDVSSELSNVFAALQADHGAIQEEESLEDIRARFHDEPLTEENRRLLEEAEHQRRALDASNISIGSDGGAPRFV
jgi:hypothetical protein